MRAEKLKMFSAVHLYYEIDMCEKAVRLLPSAALVLNNVALESYALHLRNLVEFLYSEPTQPDDVNAVHFVRSKSEWLTARGLAPAVLFTAKKRADKQVAHLTKKRYAEGAPEKTWTPAHEIAALVEGLKLFLEHADPDRLHPCVREAVDSLGSIFTAAPSGKGGT